VFIFVPSESLPKHTDGSDSRQTSAQLINAALVLYAKTFRRASCCPTNQFNVEKNQEDVLVGFRLSELHDCWQALKENGKVPEERVPLPVRDALKELGVAEVDWLTRDLVLTEIGMVGPRKIKPS
jgi:hypothetical protein